MTDWTQILQFLQTLTAQVGDQLLADFAQIHSLCSELKQDGSLVTESDRWADNCLKAALTKQFPSYGVLTEESESIFPSTDWCWVVDPLDGTTNFARGIPIWAISIGLLYQGVPVFGYVYLPPLRQVFHGWFANSNLNIGLPENQAWLNGIAIASSQDNLTSNHFFSLCSRSLETVDQVRLGTKTKFPCKLRMLGAASYNLLTVATGATLGAIEATPKIWDIAAAWVIVQAAHGIWLPLEPQALFPLVVGKNYSDRSYPTLVVSQPDLIPIFESLAQPLYSA